MFNILKKHTFALIIVINDKSRILTYRYCLISLTGILSFD